MSDNLKTQLETRNLELETWERLPPMLGRGKAGQQLALSESLLATEVERPALWWYSAEERALILGTSQKPEAVNLKFCRDNNIQVFRRTSGGAAVLAEPEFLSLDVVLPPGHAFAPSDVVETYRWLGESWLLALQKLGLETGRLVATQEVRAAKQSLAELDSVAGEREKLARLVCFGSLSPYEVAVGGRKLVGLAQIRRRTGTLLQCGLPLRLQSQDFASLLALAASQSPVLTEALGERLTGLSEFLGHKIEPETVIQAFESVLAEKWHIQLKAVEWPAEKLAQAKRFEQEKFVNLVAEDVK